MSLHLAFIDQTPFPQIIGGMYALWRYQVTLDESVTDGRLGLGLTALVDIRDPAQYPGVVELQGSTLVKPIGGVQFVTVDVAQAINGLLDIVFAAPTAEDSFAPITLVAMAAALGTPQMLPFRTEPGGMENTTQVIYGPAATVAAIDPTPPVGAPDPTPPGGVMPAILPYASEPFGVYQPLIGWRSALSQEKLSSAISWRFRRAAGMIGDAASLSARKPIASVSLTSSSDRTGTMIGSLLAAYVSNATASSTPLDWKVILADSGDSPLAANAHKAITELQKAGASVTAASTVRLPEVASQNDPIMREAATATLLHYLAQTSPNAVEYLFKGEMEPWQRAVAALDWFAGDHAAGTAYLSPIGILHLFREYFFELGTFLGPPVGHVWISPGGTVELIEVNTRKTVVDSTVEQSTETVQKTDLSETSQDELSDAVKVENANDTKLGVTAAASGGVAGIFQASASASFNLDNSRKQAQEQTHKKMREQSSKLSSEVRQNYKTTFRTVTETTDTSSRRYVLQNTSTELVSYELSRKMRKVAVQVQDLGQQLCWQLYIDNPGDSLGLGEFVHATSAALDPGVKQPDYKPYPDNLQKTYSESIPFILYQGADSDASDTYLPLPGNPNFGVFSPQVGTDDHILFLHQVKCPPAPAGFLAIYVGGIDFHGAQVEFELFGNTLSQNNSFSILLTYANFGGKLALPFDVTIVYEATDQAKQAIDQANAAAKTAYDDQVALQKEQLFYDTLRARLKLIGQVKPRPQDDLREEERSVIYRAIIARLYGNESGWTSDEFHVAAELIRYLFDVDSMLYFVAPDWWRPRQQPLVSKDNQGELQPTIVAEPAVSDVVVRIGKHPPVVIPGHRPYYLITEETEPAPQGASLGWLTQLDGDAHRNAFLNSPWVKAVLPIRPGRERDAIAWLQRPEVAGTDGLAELYPFDPTQDPPDYNGLTIEQVLLKIADSIAAEYEASLTPVPVDPAKISPQMALPTETVFTHGFDPLEGGIKFGADAFTVFSQWIEVLPTDQVVATEYKLTGL